MEKKEVKGYLTESFKDALTYGVSTPTAVQLISVIEFALESFFARESEGWREGVIDGLCRQLTKIAVPDLLDRYWHFCGPWSVVEKCMDGANDHFGIRQSVKDVFLKGEDIDLVELRVSLKDYWGDLLDWIKTEFGEELDGFVFGGEEDNE
jgi:hypothetical protein